MSNTAIIYDMGNGTQREIPLRADKIMESAEGIEGTAPIIIPTNLSAFDDESVTKTPIVRTIFHNPWTRVTRANIKLVPYKKICYIFSYFNGGPQTGTGFILITN